MTESSTPSHSRVQFWHHLTAAEIAALAPTAVTILPTASTEQHGPHLVTGTDTLLNDLLQKGLREMPPPRGEFLVLPTLALGTSEHHVPFGGTLTIPPILYTEVLVAMIRTLIRQGHKRIFLLNSHGGNQAPISTAIAEVAGEATEQEVLVGGASYWTLCNAAWKKEVENLVLDRVGHACEIETSLLMLARPDLPVRCVPEGVPFAPTLEGGWSFAGSFPALTREGHIGFPKEASREKGEQLFKTAVRELGEFFSRFSELPLTRDLRKG